MLYDVGMHIEIDPDVLEIGMIESRGEGIG